MNKLQLRGILRHIDGKKYISYKTSSKEHLLPVVSDSDFPEGSWVSFLGTLCTKSYEGSDGRRHKRWYGKGVIKAESTELYINIFSTSGVVVKIEDLRITPLTHRKVVDFVIAVGKYYYNCVAFGKVAKSLISDKKVGSSIDVHDSYFSSRDYSKDGVVHTAYELCVRNFS